MPRICGVGMAEEPGTASWSAVSGSNDQDSQEGTRPLEGWKEEFAGVARAGGNRTHWDSDGRRCGSPSRQTVNAHCVNSTCSFSAGWRAGEVNHNHVNHTTMSYKGWRRPRLRVHTHERTRHIKLFS
eukprot:3009781-Rhodomonas_salina.1